MLNDEQLRLQAEIEAWKEHKITKMQIAWLEQMNLDVWASFQAGNLLGNEQAHGKALGALELAGRMVHFEDETIVEELCPGIPSDKSKQ